LGILGQKAWARIRRALVLATWAEGKLRSGRALGGGENPGISSRGRGRAVAALRRSQLRLLRIRRMLRARSRLKSLQWRCFRPQSRANEAGRIIQRGELMISAKDSRAGCLKLAR